MIYDLIKEYLLIGRLKLKKNELIPKSWGEGTKGNMVLLPGLNEKYVFLEKLADFFNNSGYKIHVVKYDPNDKIENITEVVANYIKNMGLKRVILLGHSKGGLVAKYLMDYFPKVNRVIIKSISIATPYGGSLLGYFRIWNSWHLRPGSEILIKVRKKNENLSKIINIYSRVDNHVIPNRNLVLDGAKNIMVDMVGHTRIVESEETRKIIKNEL